MVASRRDAQRRAARLGVSIPFIAGQWSLPKRLNNQIEALARFNPLHCGAVVASSASATPWRMTPTCFNPLHCGAVVASSTQECANGTAGRVSIPFIAGQWSLRVAGGGARGAGTEFQSPSLRGSGRFSAMRDDDLRAAMKFQSPSLRGSGRFEESWELDEVHALVFQSPSLRGSGRFARKEAERRAGHAFQSPSLRGSGRFSDEEARGQLREKLVSIPFIAGQWSLRPGPPGSPVVPCLFQSPSLRGSGRFRPSGHHWPAVGTCFNPLHCGAVVASAVGTDSGRYSQSKFQSPSLRGSGRFTIVVRALQLDLEFQSPSLRGSGRFLP